jgi:FRG domain-containing protein
LRQRREHAGGAQGERGVLHDPLPNDELPADLEHAVGRNDVVAGSWLELTELLYSGSWQPRLRRHRSTFAFRGVSNARHDLRTALARLGAESPELERHILRSFRKYAPQNAVPGDSTWNWLAVAQHHGAPTRLLDWTYSPFVAMHFATAQEMDTDGVIWCVDANRANELLPDLLKRILADEGTPVFTAEMLERAAETPQDFDALADDDFVVFFEPPSFDERIVNQSALFALKSNPRVGLDRWLANHQSIFRRVILPAAIKWEVRDKLDQANITERVLFPGLDGLSRWLTRYYTPSDLAALGSTSPPARDVNP